jgi:hypothetical protein
MVTRNVCDAADSTPPCAIRSDAEGCPITHVGADEPRAFAMSGTDACQQSHTSLTPESDRQSSLHAPAVAAEARREHGLRSASRRRQAGAYRARLLPPRPHYLRGWAGRAPRAVRPWDVGDDDVSPTALGCSRGRVLYMAARCYRFKRVVGVDLSAERVTHARLIVDRHRASLRCDASSCAPRPRLAAARRPHDRLPLYAFGGDAAHGGLESRRVARPHPRRVRILFAAPNQTEALLDTGRSRVHAHELHAGARCPSEAGMRPDLLQERAIARQWADVAQVRREHAHTGNSTAAATSGGTLTRARRRIGAA